MAVSALFPQIWSARVTYLTGQISAFLPNATREWEGEAIYGNTVKIPTVEDDVTLRDYSRTADLAAPEDIDASTQDLSIDQEKYFNFSLEDLDARQSRIPAGTLIDTKANGAAKAIAAAIDGHVLTTIQAIGASTLLKNNAAAAFDAEMIADVKYDLTVGSLPWSGFVMVTTPEFVRTVEKAVIDKTYGDVILAEGFRNGLSQDPSASGAGISNGLAMRMGGFPVYVSNDVRLRQTNAGATPTSGRGTRSELYVYNPRDLGLVWQVNKTESYRMERRFADAVKGLANYGCKVLNGGRFIKYVIND